MRRSLFIALLAALALGAWNLVRLDGAPSPPARPPESDASASPMPAEPEPPRGADALSLEQHPGRVADEAGIFANYLPTLLWQTQAWHDDLGVEFHVATLADADLPIEALAADVLTRRRIGEDAPTGGILLLIDPIRRQARIEVSYDLEAAFPDALVGRIAEDQLVPYAAYGAMGMATMDVLHLLKDVAIQQSLRGALALDDSYRQREPFLERARFLSGGAGARVELPTLEELAGRDFKARIPDPQRGRYAPSSDPVESAEAFLRSKKDFVGDPSLSLYTPGTQCMKRHYPFAPFEEAERAQRLEAGRPWRVASRGDRAVVTASRRVHGFVPVLLHRIDGTWRVDLVETWKNLFFDRSGNYNLRNAATPYAFGLGSHGGTAAPFDIETWSLGGVPLERVLETLEAEEGPLSDFLLGEVLFRNCFLPDKALFHYEAALEKAPNSLLFAETLGDRATYMGFVDLAIRAYQAMNSWGDPKLAAAYAAKGDYDRAIAIARRVRVRDPYDTEALRALVQYLELAKHPEQAAELEETLAALEADPRRPWRSLEIAFDPLDPILDIREPTLVGDTKVFDHAYFQVAVSNPSGRPVDVEKIKVVTTGSAHRSGLGDIRNYFQWPNPTPNRLEPGQTIRVERTWGFTVDTGHDQLSYVLDVCWRGDGDEPQCDSRRLDLMPR